MKTLMLLIGMFATLMFGFESLAQQIIASPIPVSNNNTQAAQQAASALSKGAQMNMMIGGIMLGSCLSGMMGSTGKSGGSSGGLGGLMSPNMLMCMMGGLLLVQGMQQNKAANQANQSLQASSNTVYVGQPVAVAPPTAAYPYGAVPTTPVPLTATVLQGAPASATRGLAALNSAGYQVTSAGVTLPNGRFMDAASLNTNEGLASAGFDSNAIHTFQTASASARQQAAQQLGNSHEEE